MADSGSVGKRKSTAVPSAPELFAIDKDDALDIYATPPGYVTRDELEKRNEEMRNEMQAMLYQMNEMFSQKAENERSVKPKKVGLPVASSGFQAVAPPTKQALAAAARSKKSDDTSTDLGDAPKASTTLVVAAKKGTSIIYPASVGGFRIGLSLIRISAPTRPY